MPQYDIFIINNQANSKQSDNSMKQQIAELMLPHPTQGQSDCSMDKKLQLFQKKDQPTPSFLQKETSSKRKIQTFNQESYSEDNESECDSSEVSFEDDILQSHETMLNLQIEKGKSLFTQQNLQKKFNKNVVKVGSFYDNLNKTLMALPNANSQLISAFHFHLQKDEIFKQFLDHIHFSYPHRVSNKLLQLSFLTWNLYRPLLGMSLSKNQVFMFIKDLCPVLYANQSIFRIEKNQSPAAQRTKMRQNFIQFFVTTVLFVMQGFFENPLCSEPLSPDRRRVRQLNRIQDINELEPECRKMVKMDCIKN